jgi:ABC-type branched-subunit amino acid transport system ATPase component
VKPETVQAEPLLSVEHLTVSYNRSAAAVRDVSFTAAEGQIIAIVGLNGAGKTTSLRAISGFIASERATVKAERIELAGLDLRGMRPNQSVRAGVALVPERNKIFAELTVEENLRLHRDGGRRRSEVDAVRGLVLDTFPALGQRMMQLAGYMSGGERQQLAIASALLGRPRVLLLDEMSLGLAPLVVESLTSSLRRINEELGLTIVVVEQNLHVAVSLASTLYVLVDGVVVDRRSTDALIDTDELAAQYLGVPVGSVSP